MFAISRKSAFVALVLVVALPFSTAFATAPPGQPVQVELGDSWTFGDGAFDPATAGYAGIVYERNRTDLDCVPAAAEQAIDGCHRLQRVVFARAGTVENPGVTTQRLINEQLDAATTLIAARNGDGNPANDVEVVLLTVGGNDVSGPVLQACLGGLTAGCLSVIRERIDQVRGNLDQILASIQSAAGDDARVVIATYDNAIEHCPIGATPGAAQLGDLVLEGHPALAITGLNDVIRSTAGRHGVKVADTFGRLGAGDWVGDCLHPNDAGYAAIADVVAVALAG